MEKLQIFKFEENAVRTLSINDEPYFLGRDIAEVLGYSRPTKAVQDHVDDEDKDVVQFRTPSEECKTLTLLMNLDCTL